MYHRIYYLFIYNDFLNINMAFQSWVLLKGKTHSLSNSGLYIYIYIIILVHQFILLNLAIYLCKVNYCLKENNWMTIFNWNYCENTAIKWRLGKPELLTINNCYIKNIHRECICNSNEEFPIIIWVDQAWLNL